MLAGLVDDHGLVTLATAASAGLWLAAVGALYLVRRPEQPPPGPHTLALGPEPPAVASFLVNRLRVCDEAVSATLLDLAAREVVEIEQRGPGVFYVRLLRSADASLTAYELRVLRHLEATAEDGVAPARALTTGSAEHSRRWRRGFDAAVVADVQRRGLSRERLDNRQFTALGVASLIPAGLVWRLFGGWELGGLVLVGAVAFLGWIKARHSQQPTPEGTAASSRWLGVRAALDENEVFETRSPLEVPLWNRLLAYGAALGVAGVASSSLPMGVEADDRAWSAHGGRWREVRIRYPRLFPLGWGTAPHLALLQGIAIGGGGAAALVLFVPLARVADGLWLAVVGPVLVVACAAIGAGVMLIATAVADFGGGIRVTGPILRLRAKGTDKRRRHYLAVDDGSSATIRAWVVDAWVFTGLSQGDVVTVEVTRILRAVRSLVRTTDVRAAPSAGADARALE